MREDVRVKKEWLNPSTGERRGGREANIQLRGADERRLTCMLVATRRDQGYRADVVAAIRAVVNAVMQPRREADEKCPGKRRKQSARNKNTRAGL